MQIDISANQCGQWLKDCVTCGQNNQVVGKFIAVVIVKNSVWRIPVAYEVQGVNCFVATGKPVGLILNFGERKAEAKKKVRTLGQG